MTDGEEVGERGPGDGREAGQDELLEIPSDDENETTPALTLDAATDPTTDRSLAASHGESLGWGSEGSKVDQVIGFFYARRESGQRGKQKVV